MRYTGYMGYKTYTCPLAKRCGGCELLAVPYELQLRRKQTAMEELFERVVKADHAVLHPIVGMEEPRAYRHKAASPYAPGPHSGHAPASSRGDDRHGSHAGRKAGRQSADKLSRMRCGFYERGTHRIAFCKDCLVEAPGARQVLVEVARVADQLGITAYQEDQGRGTLRHAVVRCGYATEDVLLTVVTNGEHLPHAKEFVDLLRSRHPRITSIVQNVNDRRTNAILGTRNRTLWGPGVMHDRLLNCTFEIGPTSFYQTNPAQTEVLYRLAIQGIGDAKSLLDAYCGTGTIGICAAAQARDDGRPLQVTGIEQVSGAVGCARRNARANDLSHTCRFVCADATQWMASQTRTTYDAVILDPPRAGSTPQFLEGIARLAPERVVYVSCNPTTQVRDLEVLRKRGYTCESVAPVDLFPHTKHVETVTVLTRD